MPPERLSELVFNNQIFPKKESIIAHQNRRKVSSVSDGDNHIELHVNGNRQGASSASGRLKEGKEAPPIFFSVKE